MTIHREHIEKAAAFLSIQDVYMASHQVALLNGYSTRASDEELVILSKHYPTKTQIVDEDDRPVGYRIYYYTAMLLINEEKEKSIAIEDLESEASIKIEATFIAEYAVNNEELEKLTQDEAQDSLREFSKCNAGFHVWPFWREFVQSSATRISLNPTPPVPMYMVSKDCEDCDDTSEEQK